jgi:hypothetical protein
MSWFNIDWHLVICDSSWISWFLRLNIHLPFSITYGSSTSRLLLALLRCMVHRDQVIVNPSSTTILSHTILHVLYRPILWKPSYVPSYFHRYPILRYSTWSIFHWSRSRHKWWTKLIFNFFLFIYFSYLIWHRFFNIGIFFAWLYMLIT